MELIRILLIIHIIAGFTALAAGAVAIFSNKGQKLHSSAGITYYWSMTFIALTAIGISLIKDLGFLLLVALFSYYLTFTGKRSLALKRVKGWASVPLTDRMAWFASLLTAAGLLGAGALQMITLPQAAMVFGGVLTAMCVDDFLFFKNGNPDKKAWLYRHIRRMGGAYIATFTAFFVVNIHTNPEYLGWILPTIIGSPLIAITVRRYRTGKTGLTKIAG